MSEILYHKKMYSFEFKRSMFKMILADGFLWIHFFFFNILNKMVHSL